MKPLILLPTDLSQWHALVSEVEVQAQTFLNEETESYLVFLLMRFSHDPKLTESIIGLDFLQAMQKPRRLQIQGLREVGDKSLLFCGFFPEIAKRRRLSLNYFSDLGQAAYLTVSELEEKQSAALFMQLSEHFATLQKILQNMRSMRSVE